MLDTDKHKKKRMVSAEVRLSCRTCERLMKRYIERMVEFDGTGFGSSSFRQFCEAIAQTETDQFTEADIRECISMAANLQARAGTVVSASPSLPTPGFAARFLAECSKKGGPPSCYKGKKSLQRPIVIESSVVSAGYCPFMINEGRRMINATCSNHGACRLKKGGGVFCLCDVKYHGKSCEHKEAA
ncbi:unnamed protein product [Vitrella brassicaformis CCMP3155]|uniref:EGF-like domain-containing protein n=1 Tax=Vitrella brassicaformis (strain CCMP3155) TaxID=1169540 RepID=A0A0G4G055_VITBC|nr:unnamed protein product [Vitrella brassicaformis CCMP3155]|eukprot:CEM20897.1 unnamed protein product [Vitrella brassicaformis CCMP3155]